MIESLISPLSIEDFLSSYHSITAFHSVGDSNRFSGLFQWADVNDFLSNSRAGDTSINFVGNGRKVPFVSVNLLRQEVASGQTIEIDNLQEVDPVIRAMCDACSAEFNTEVNINAYISHPAAQGFNLHYDLQDVFIVQTEGVKRWHVYAPTEIWPTRAVNSDELDPATDPYLDILLKPGGVLYIPRGHWHKAQAIEPCVHLTVTVPFTNGTSVLTHIIEKLSVNHAIFRKDLPIHNIKGLGGTLSENRLEQQLEEITDTLVQVLADRNRVKQYLYEFTVQNAPVCKDVNMPALGRLGHELSPQTRLTRNTKQPCILKVVCTGNVQLHTAGQVFEFEGIPMSAINCLVAENSPITGEIVIEKSKHNGYTIEWPALSKVILVMVNSGVLALGE